MAKKVKSKQELFVGNIMIGWLQRVRLRRRWTIGRRWATLRAIERLDIAESNLRVEHRLQYTHVDKRDFKLLGRRQRLYQRRSSLYYDNRQYSVFYYLTGLIPLRLTSSV